MENTDDNQEYLFENLEDHQIDETDFTKLNSPNFTMINRLPKGYKEGVSIGDISIETPLSFFLKKYYMKNMSCYIGHRQIFLNGCTNDTNYIFLTEEDLLITSEYEDEKLQKNENKDEINTNNPNDINRKFSKVNPILMKIEYRQIYKIESLEFNSLLIKFIKTENLSKLSEITIKFFSVKECILFNHLINKIKILNWQKYFESAVPINKPHMYQNHFFLQKVNSRGKNQSRLILLSDKFIYNLTFDLFKHDKFILIDTVKWAIAIESLVSLVEFKKKTETLKLNINVASNKKLVSENKLKFKNKKEMELIFNSKTDFGVFMFNIKRLFYNSTKKNLAISLN